MASDESAKGTTREALYAVKEMADRVGLNDSASKIVPDQICTDIEFDLRAFDDDARNESAFVAIEVLNSLSDSSECSGDLFLTSVMRRRWSSKPARYAVAALAAMLHQHGAGFFKNGLTSDLGISRVARLLMRHEETYLNRSASILNFHKGVASLRAAIEQKGVGKRRGGLAIGVAAMILVATVTSSVLVWTGRDAGPDEQPITGGQPEALEDEPADLSSLSQNLRVDSLVFDQYVRPPNSEMSVSGSDRIQSVVVAPGEVVNLDVAVMLVDPSRFTPNEYSDLTLSVQAWRHLRPMADASFVYNESQPNGYRLEQTLDEAPAMVQLNSDGTGISFRSIYTVAEAHEFACGRSVQVIESWFRSERVAVMSPNLVYVDNDCSR